MLGQEGEPVKFKSTLLTLVLVGGGVNSAVSPQNVAAEEALVANAALVRSLVSMSPQVNLQIVPRAGKHGRNVKKKYPSIIPFQLYL